MKESISGDYNLTIEETHNSLLCMIVCFMQPAVLDLSTRIDDLKAMTLELRRLSQEVVVLPSSGQTCPSNFIFTEESASIYKEWIVRKKNRWGRKQRRQLGIDRHTLYNNSETKTVKRVARAISDVVDVRVVPSHPKCFDVLFRDVDSSEVLTVTYEAPDMVVTRSVSQLVKSWSNAVAPVKTPSKSVAAEVVQLPIGWSKATAP